MNFLIEFWSRHRKPLLGTAIVLTAMAACWRIGNELPPLLSGTRNTGIDLKIRHDDVRHWFSGVSIYDGEPPMNYPPASYPLLWPFLGWSSFDTSRWLWGWVCLASAGGFAALSFAKFKAKDYRLALLLALLPMGAYGSAATIRVGQFSLLVLLMLGGWASFLDLKKPSIASKVASGLLLAASLLKPTLSIPFVIVAFLKPRQVVTVVSCVLGYLSLSVYAASFQDASLPALLVAWLEDSAAEEGFYKGHAHLYRAMALMGLDSAVLPVTVLVLGLFTTWVFLHRHTHHWVLIGLAAIATRLIFYHRLYDDILLLLAIVALLHLAMEFPRSDASIIAGVLFVLNWIAMLAPGSLLNEPGPLRPWAEIAQVLLWTATLGFLMSCCQRAHEAGQGTPACEPESSLHV